MAHRANLDTAFLRGGGETGALMRALDWAATPLGRAASWPQPLKTLVSVMLGSQQPMFIAWGPEKTLLYNDGYAPMLGLRHPRALGRPFAEAWYDIMGTVGPIVERAYAGESIQMDDIAFVMHRNGYPEETHFAFSYTPICDEAGQVAGFFCACTETTLQVIDGRQRVAEREQLQQMFEQAPGIIAMLEGPEHSFVLANAAYRQLFADRDIIGKPIRDVLPEMVEQGTVERLDRVYATGERFCGEAMPFRLPRHPDEPPEERYADFIFQPITDTTGQVTGIFIEGTEVTRHVQAEAKLRESEARFRALFEQASDYILTADLDQTITSCNPAAAAALGYRPEEIVGRSIADFMPPEYFDRAREMLAEKLKIGGSTRYTVEVVAKDGRLQTWDINSTLTTAPDGSWSGLHVLARDMSEAHAAQVELAANEEMLRLAQEAAGLGAFDWELATDRVKVSGDYLDIYGFSSADEVSPKTLLERIHPDDLTRMMAVLADATRGQGPEDTEWRIIHPTKGVRWVRTNARAFFDETGQPLRRIGVVKDITQSRQALEAVKRSEERLRLATEGARIGLWDWDLVAMHGWWSPRTAEIMGLDSGDSIAGSGISLEQRLERVHPEDREGLQAKIEAALAPGGKEYDHEYRIVRPDGLVSHVHSRGVVMRDAEGRAVRITGTMLDVTEERASEARLRESEERLRLALESARMGTWEIDIRSGVSRWSPITMEIYGVDRAVMSREERLCLVHPDDRDHLRKSIAAAHESGRYTAEYRVQRPSGEVRWLSSYGIIHRDASGESVRAIGTVQDITERKQAADALKESEARLRRAQEAGGIGSYEWNLNTGEGHQSDSMLRMAGFEPGQFYTLGEIMACVLPEDKPVIRTTIEAIGKGVERSEIDYRIQRPSDGAVRWIRDVGRMERADNGQPVRWVGIVQDVTDRKEVEERLQRLNDELQERVTAAVREREMALQQLHEAQKLETLGQLTGGVAHDFNNLLTPIVGSLDLLRRRLPEDPKAERLIDGALQAADRARTLVSRLLAFGRRQVLQPRPTDVGALLHGMTDLIQRTIGQHINVVVEPADDLPAARVDPNQLELAILNLSVNARDAMPGGGTLTITADSEVLARGNKPGLSAGPYIRLSVIDTGSGMDEATLKRAVEPFFTTKGVGKGTGLGLSMIHGLAGQLGGALDLSSTVGSGTRVDLWLPVAEAEAEPRAAPAPAPAHTQRSTAGTCILLVDDEELVRMGAAAMLAELGHEIVEASSGAAALRLLEEGSGVDALVTDYLMPGMNGVELVEEARKLRPGLPALIMTGYANITGLAPDIALLAKPFRHDEFAEKLSMLLKEKRRNAPEAQAAC